MNISSRYYKSDMNYYLEKDLKVTFNCIAHENI